MNATPSPFTMQDLEKAWDAACVKAWDENRAEPSVTLPEGVLPEVATMVNPVTRSKARIRRVPMFAWDNRTAFVPAAPSMTSAQLRVYQDALNAVVGEHGWRGKIVVVPPAAMGETA